MNYEKYMKKCIKLALKAEGQTSPNPLVGCVVLDKSGNEIATGYHHRCGDNHAERDALLKLKNGEAEGGTLIVNLEPCSHFGKTPPCVDLIIEKKIKKVVIGMEDVNLIVKGNGIKKLEHAGIEVTVGVLENECKKLNEIFIKNMNDKKIFVASKIATTLDGKIATSNGSSKWITSDKARKEVLKIRNRYDAILTSSETILKDNPTMAHKTKILIDRNLKCDYISKFFKDGKIYVFTTKKSDFYAENIEFLPYENLQMVLKKLYDKGIRSILIECGGRLNGSFLKENLIDKVYHFVAPKITNDNASRSCFDGDNIFDINNSKQFIFSEIKKFQPDILLEYYI